jgi:hypothetical protein
MLCLITWYKSERTDNYFEHRHNKADEKQKRHFCAMTCQISDALVLLTSKGGSKIGSGRNPGKGGERLPW